MKPVNRLDHVPSIDELLPTTKLDRLLSEDDRRLFEPQPWESAITRESFERLARWLSSTMPRDKLCAVYYHAYYGSTCDQVAAGASVDDILAEVTFFGESDVELSAVIWEAIQNALAGRPPRLQSREAG